MTQSSHAKFGLGQIVRHTAESFRGLVVDVDAAYAAAGGQPDAERRNQPFYRVLAMGEDSGFLVYAAEDVLELDPNVQGLSPEEAARWFTVDDAGHHAPRAQPIH